jgi:ankyrin repeat protein
MRLLIEHGADVTARNETDLTPLLLVSSWVSVIATSFLIHCRLIQAGGQGNLTSRDEELKSEQSAVKAKTARALIEKGADVNAKDASCSTALLLASTTGSYETVGLLIEHGADVAARDRSDRTPLHLALSWVCLTTASLLIQQRLT